jgi:hypothetical protein
MTRITQIETSSDGAATRKHLRSLRASALQILRLLDLRTSSRKRELASIYPDDGPAITGTPVAAAKADRYKGGPQVEPKGIGAWGERRAARRTRTRRVGSKDAQSFRHPREATTKRTRSWHSLDTNVGRIAISSPVFIRTHPSTILITGLPVIVS